MPTVELTLHAAQELFVNDRRSPTLTYQGGAGSGKTHAGAVKALLYALENPGSRGMIVGATFPSMRQSIMPELESVAGAMTLRDAWGHNRSTGEITLPNGSLIWLRSADNPDSLLGADLSWLWGDEVGLWKRDAYRYLMGRLRQPGFPHQAWFTYTPKGRNWAWDELGRERDGLRIVRSSSLDNPFVGQDFRDRLKREYGEGSSFWRQEVSGEFVAFEGLIYPMFSQELHVLAPPPGTRFVRVVAGVDWGWLNPGAIYPVGLDADGVAWVLAEVYEPERSVTSWWAPTAAELARKYRVECFYADPSEPGNIAEFRAAGVNCQKAVNEVIPGITSLASRIAAGKLRVAPECTNLIAEFGMYSWKTRPDGTTKADEPDKTHDHAMDALRYAEMALARPARDWFGVYDYASEKS